MACHKLSCSPFFLLSFPWGECNEVNQTRKQNTFFSALSLCVRGCVCVCFGLFCFGLRTWASVFFYSFPLFSIPVLWIFPHFSAFSRESGDFSLGECTLWDLRCPLLLQLPCISLFSFKERAFQLSPNTRVLWLMTASLNEWMNECLTKWMVEWMCDWLDGWAEARKAGSRL